VLVRVVIVWHAIGALLLVFARTARADDNSSGGGTGAGMGHLFGFMHLKDSHGIDASSYILSIDHGNATPGDGWWRGMWAFLITLEYEIYQTIVMVAIYFVRWVLGFGWLQTLLGPAHKIGDAVASMTGQLDLTPFMLTLAGFAVAIWFFRGRYSTGVYEGAMSCLIAALAVGLLAHPVDTVGGPHGMITRARDTGLQIAAGLADNGNADANPQAQVDTATGQLVDTFLREPTQLINFGRVLDDPGHPGQGHCGKEFDDAYLHPYDDESAGQKIGDAVGGAQNAIRNGLHSIPLIGPTLVGPDIGGDALGALLPHKDKPEDVLKNKIGKCDKDLKAYADNPGPEQAAGLLLLIPAALLILLFAVFLAGRVVLATIGALITAIKLIFGVIIGIAPVMRGQLLRSFADIALALMQLVFSIVYVVVYAVAVASLFTGEANLLAVALFTDVALVAGLIIYWRGIKGLHHWSQRLAEAMGRRPSAAPVVINRRSRGGATELWAQMQLARSAARGGKNVAGSVARTAAKAGRFSKAAAGAVTGGAAAAVAAGGKAVVDKAAKSAKTAGDPVADAAAATGAATFTARTAAALRGRLGKNTTAQQAGTAIRRKPGSVTARAAARKAGAEAMRHDGRTWLPMTGSEGHTLWVPTGRASTARKVTPQANPVARMATAPRAPRPTAKSSGEAKASPQSTAQARMRAAAAKPPRPGPTKID
jgi:hypothetical protein